MCIRKKREDNNALCTTLSLPQSSRLFLANHWVDSASTVQDSQNQTDRVEQRITRGWLGIGERCIMGMQRVTNKLLYKIFLMTKMIAQIFTLQCDLLTWKDKCGLTCI